MFDIPSHSTQGALGLMFLGAGVVIVLLSTAQYLDYKKKKALRDWAKLHELDLPD